MTNQKNLTQRQKNVLFAIIKEFCDNNDSVGSKELASKYGFTFSPATIRNEMVALRELGYLYQPFTNSSSQPTEKAFKLFINRLIDGIQVSSQQQHKLTDKIRELQHKQTEMNREIAKLLADQVGGVGFSLSQNKESVKGSQTSSNTAATARYQIFCHFWIIWINISHFCCQERVMS
jgi:heat-inducible transcriptional repressor